MARRIRPNALVTKNSRYSMGGVTEGTQDVLGWWEPFPTDALKSYAEVPFEITPQYANRPDLIAHKFFGSAGLAWLILQHNTIVDTIEELTTGTVIMIPDPDRVRLGLSSLKASSAPNKL
jgi:hypothetical protein